MHWGHLLMAETALHQAKLQQVIWVPTRYPPYKSPQELLDVHHRLEMVKRAIADHPVFTASTAESDKPEQTQSFYAIDTLLHLKTVYPHSQWYWIIGLDAFQSLPRWYRRRELAAQCCWLVAPRLGVDLSRVANVGCVATAATQPFNSVDNSDEKRHDDPMQSIREMVVILCQKVVQAMAEQAIDLNWQLLQMPLLEVSSSLVRQYCRDRRSIRYLVPEAVRSYILNQALYRNPK